jgi:hypothetical protein
MVHNIWVDPSELSNLEERPMEVEMIEEETEEELIIKEEPQLTSKPQLYL